MRKKTLDDLFTPEEVDLLLKRLPDDAEEEDDEEDLSPAVREANDSERPLSYEEWNFVEDVLLSYEELCEDVLAEGEVDERLRANFTVGLELTQGMLVKVHEQLSSML